LGSGRPLVPDPAALGHVGWVERIAISADSSLLASRASDGSIRTWDLETGQGRHKHELPRDKGWGSAALAFADGGRHLVYARMDFLADWDARTGRQTLFRQMPEAWLPGACMTADGSTVVRVDPIKGQNGQWRISLLDTLTGTQGSSRILHMADWFGRG